MENQIDKSKELRGSITLVNNKLQFKGEVTGNSPVMIDYVPPLGDNLGYTSLELLLLSLSSCVGSAFLVVLRKMQKTITHFDIAAVGVRREENPTGFKSIALEINLQSDNITTEEMAKVLGVIEGICPVLSMVKGNVEITYNFNITK
jgi:putative redox protein